MNILLDLLATLATLLCVALSKHSSLEPGSVPHCPPQLQRALAEHKEELQQGPQGTQEKRHLLSRRTDESKLGLKLEQQLGLSGILTVLFLMLP